MTRYLRVVRGKRTVSESTPRPTAAIDTASLRNDISGVEQAIKAYANADEVVISVRVENSFTHAVPLCLEPYAEEVVLAPGQAAVVFACGPEPQWPADRLHIECSDERITVWLWGGTLGYVVPELNGAATAGGG